MYWPEYWSPATTDVELGDYTYSLGLAENSLVLTLTRIGLGNGPDENGWNDWLSNKGYPTKKHRDAIRQYGITPYHRKSYNLLGTEELSLDFSEI